MRTRRWLIAIGVGLAIVLLAGRGIAAVYVDYLWYASLGAEAIWKVKAVASAAVWILSTVAGIAFVFANLYAVRRTVASVTLPSRVANLEIGEELPPPYLTGAAAVLSMALGLILTFPRSKWPAIELVRTGEPFGESDPYFQRDLSFWIAQLPFETDLFLWSLIATLLVTVVVVFFYAMTRSVRWERGGIVVGPHARRHFSVLGALMLLLLAWSYRLDSFELLNLGSGHDGAFTYLDHHVAKPVGAVLAVVSAAAALIVLITGWMGQGAAAGWTVGGVLLLSLLLHQIGPLLARRAAEPRDPDRRERPYLATRAGYTRRAYAIDRIDEADSANAFRSAREAALGMPVWEAAALAQRSRSANGTVTVGWGRQGDVPTALIVRTGDDWSVTSVDARRTDARGAAVRADENGGALVSRSPLVYPGATGHRVVGDSAGRVVAPRLDRGLVRLAYAWSLQEFGLLSGDLPHPAPRMVVRRDVRERISALAPFFVIGGDVAPVVDGDSLLWVAHLYSASSSYPLSRRFVLAGGERAYFQHAAIALVDASSGRVTFVADSLLDPIARGWIRRFPSVFRQRPVHGALLRRLVPGTDFVRAQALGFAAAGTRTESVPRHVPWQDGADSALANGPPTPMFLGDERFSVPAQVQILLDGLERVGGVIVVTGGASPRARWLPAAENAPRWTTVLEQLRGGTDTTAIAGANLAHGAVRALPIGDSLVLMQTTYALRSGLPPSIARITLYAGGRTVSSAALADALGVSGIDPLETTLTSQDLRARVTELYDAMRRALQRGDWTAFGDAYTRLGALLGRPPR